VSLGRVARRGSWGRLGSGGSGGWFGGVGGGSWLGRGSGDGSIRRNGRRHRLFTTVVVVVSVVSVVTIVVTIIIAIIVIAWNRSGRGRWRRSGGLNQGHRSSGGGDWTGSWSTIRLTVLLESFALLHGMATVIEELGVVLLLATHGKVTGVVGIIRLRRV